MSCEGCLEKSHEKSIEATIAYATRLAEAGDNTIYSIFVVTFVFFYIFFSNKDAREFILDQPRMVILLVFVSLVGCVCWIYMTWRIGDIEMKALGSFESLRNLQYIVKESRLLRVITISLIWFVFIVALVLAKAIWKKSKPAAPEGSASFHGWKWYPSEEHGSDYDIARNTSQPVVWRRGR